MQWMYAPIKKLSDFLTFTLPFGCFICNAAFALSWGMDMQFELLWLIAHDLLPFEKQTLSHSIRLFLCNFNHCCWHRVGQIAHKHLDMNKTLLEITYVWPPLPLPIHRCTSVGRKLLHAYGGYECKVSLSNSRANLHTSWLLCTSQYLV